MRDSGGVEFPHPFNEFNDRVVTSDVVLEFGANSVIGFGITDTLILHNDRFMHGELVGNGSNIYEIERGQIRVSGTLVTDVRDLPIDVEKGSRVSSSEKKDTSGILSDVGGMMLLTVR